MNTKQLKHIDCAGAMKHPVTVPLGLLAIIFVMGWSGQSLIIEKLSDTFFTKTEAAEFTDGLDDLIASLDNRMVNMEFVQVETNVLLNDLGIYVKTSNAYNMVRSLESDLARHQLNKANTESWTMENSKLSGQAKLANEYKDCVMHSEPQCALIQEQIWK